ncbi:MAG: SDR family NAD(P)-dependent oxidoreductase, partial [Mycobacterium sp.]
MVSVITGGAGGMGLATAKIVGREQPVVLCDVRQDRLDGAGAALAGLDITTVNCDVTDRDAVTALFDTAAGIGPVTSVIHTAGVSPSMGDAAYVVRTNAVGTVNVNEIFFCAAPEGAAIVNVASMAAHLLPDEVIPTGQFPLALQDVHGFTQAMAAVCEPMPSEVRSGFAYAVSKAFVRWYSSAQAERFNGRGLRIAGPHNRSCAHIAEIWGARMIRLSIGAPGAMLIAPKPVPMCRHITTP